ncbi:MAG: hypothetical protein IJ751_10605 [Oscillospiraceae bacterium]|nr:hypothetical protein [Oscillospiraceae bacterium]
MTNQNGRRVASTPRKGKRTKKPAANVGVVKLEKRLNRLFWQTVLSVLLFLVVFVGGGMLRGEGVYDTVQSWITRQDDLAQAVETLGRSVSEGEQWSQAIKDWCVDTFLPAQGTQDTAEVDTETLLEQGTVYQSANQRWAGESTALE